MLEWEYFGQYGASLVVAYAAFGYLGGFVFAGGGSSEVYALELYAALFVECDFGVCDEVHRFSGSCGSEAQLAPLVVAVGEVLDELEVCV